ncbi:MAG: N-6 DNA methylase [Chloroflexi bacterium]|nr:N-6 DNA methylase [Chloroflexota bacterium]
MAAKNASKIVDYISGLEVNATPEEIQAVQVFSKQLVEDYGYPKSQITTHPQHRVKASPSDKRGRYPVDIAVFRDSKKLDEQLYIVVECKKKDRRDGRSQLEDYLRLSRASLGVWFNGSARLFLQKREIAGQVSFQVIPNIPKFGQRIEDIGCFKRRDLRKTHNLKAIFKSIRNHLAANSIGATRDEVLAQQLINLIFCKLYDEKYTPPDSIVEFRAGAGEPSHEVENRILDLFEKVRDSETDIFETDDRITLDTQSIVYVVGELQNYALMSCDRDVIADAFETFIGHALKGAQGQFFTPRNVVRMIVEIIDPDVQDKIVDPACGSGGFLIEGLKHVWNKLDHRQNTLGWNDTTVEREKIGVATNNFRGIDKDYFLSKVAKAYMTLVGDGTTGIFCEDSLEKPQSWSEEAQSKIKLNSFDILITNPPFGSKIPVTGDSKLRQFDLGFKWKKRTDHRKWEKTSILKEKEEPQVLFIERCLSLLKDGGKMAMVLPDGILGNQTQTYIRQYLRDKGQVYAIVKLPFETFCPNVTIHTSVLFFKKRLSGAEEDVFISINEHCGHNKKGRPTDRDDVPNVVKYFRREASDELNFYLSGNMLENNFVAKRYLQKYVDAVEQVQNSGFPIVSLGAYILMHIGGCANRSLSPFCTATLHAS